MSDVKKAVLECIDDKPLLAREVWAQLETLGFSTQQTRYAIAELWDEGELNVGLDQRLRIPKKNEKT